MERLWRERSPPLPAYETLIRPGQAPPTQMSSIAGAPAKEPERKVKRIKLTGSLASSTAGSAAPAQASSPHPQASLPPSAAPAYTSPAPSLTVKLGGGRLTPSLAPTQQHGDASTMASTSQSPSTVAQESTVAQGQRQDSEDVPSLSARPERTEGAPGEDAKPAAIPTIPDAETGWLGGPAVRD